MQSSCALSDVHSYVQFILSCHKVSSQADSAHLSTNQCMSQSDNHQRPSAQVQRQTHCWEEVKDKFMGHHFLDYSLNSFVNDKDNRLLND